MARLPKLSDFRLWCQRHEQLKYITGVIQSWQNTPGHGRCTISSGSVATAAHVAERTCLRFVVQIVQKTLALYQTPAAAQILLAVDTFRLCRYRNSRTADVINSRKLDDHCHERSVLEADENHPPQQDISTTRNKGGMRRLDNALWYVQ